MIKLLNLVGPHSPTKGWYINIDNTAEYKYRLRLHGSKSRMGMIISNDDYYSLTTPQGIQPNSMSKLVSVLSRSPKDDTGTYIPILASATAEEDVNIIFFNYETEFGEVISNVELQNCTAIAYFVSNEDAGYSSISLSAIADDPKLPSGIMIDHGYNGGKSLSTLNVVFNGRERINKNQITTSTLVNKVDRITQGTINLPKFDLSSVCKSH